MVAMGAIPATQIPLVIIDRTFVPDAAQMTAQDPTWNWGGNITKSMASHGRLLFPPRIYAGTGPIRKSDTHGQVGLWSMDQPAKLCP